MDAEKSEFAEGRCNIESLPSITDYAAGGKALSLPTAWNDDSETCFDKLIQPKTQNSEFTLWLKGAGCEMVCASQISLVPVPIATPAAPVTGDAANSHATPAVPQFSVLSIVKSENDAHRIEGWCAFTVTCLRTARRASSEFLVCINGAAIGKPLCVNQEPPVRVRVSHRMTACWYLVQLVGEAAAGHGYTTMIQWVEQIQALVPFKVVEILDCKGSITIAFPRWEVLSMLQDAREKSDGAVPLFMCGPTCIWELADASLSSMWSAVVPCAPAEWVVKNVTSLPDGSVGSGPSNLTGVEIQMFGPDGRRILPACCAFKGLIQGDHIRPHSGLLLSDDRAKLHIIVPTYFNTTSHSKLNIKFECGGTALVQRESAVIAELTRMSQAIIITHIQPGFICFTLRSMPEQQQALLTDMVFDNAEKLGDVTFVVSRDASTSRLAYPLCARGVQIDRLFVFPPTMPCEVCAFVIYGEDTVWLMLLANYSKCPEQWVGLHMCKHAACRDMCYTLEPVHLAAAKVVLEDGDGVSTLDVTQVGKMPHRMVCAQKSVCTVTPATRPSIMLNDKPIRTYAWYARSAKTFSEVCLPSILN